MRNADIVARLIAQWLSDSLDQPGRLLGVAASDLVPEAHEAAEKLADYDDELMEQLLSDMAETMYAAPGVGLAAPQIGVGLRVFTWNVDGEVGHLVNPVLSLSEDVQDGPEGCLSLPDLTYDCRRAMRSFSISRGSTHRCVRTAAFRSSGFP